MLTDADQLSLISPEKVNRAQKLRFLRDFWPKKLSSIRGIGSFWPIGLEILAARCFIGGGKSIREGGYAAALGGVKFTQIPPPALTSGMHTHISGARKLTR